MVAVPRTTLLCIDCQFPELAARALNLSLAQCSYKKAQLFTNVPKVEGLDERVEIVAIPKISSSAEYSRFVLKELQSFVQTDFVQVIQWDGYVTRGEAWRDDFLDYDYIGARWWFRKSPSNVGNGGFSLRSRRLLEALQDPQIQAADPEDNVICLDNRDLLERRHKIRIAPGPVADAYAFEGGRPTGREFGFHRLYNFPHFYDESRLAEVMRVVPKHNLANLGGLTFVHKLLAMGRGSEAITYATITLQEPSLPAQLRGDYERFIAAETKRARRRQKRANQKI